MAILGFTECRKTVLARILCKFPKNLRITIPVIFDIELKCFELKINLLNDFLQWRNDRPRYRLPLLPGGWHLMGRHFPEL